MRRSREAAPFPGSRVQRGRRRGKPAARAAYRSRLRASQGQRALLAVSAATNNSGSPGQLLPGRRPYWLQRTSAPSDWPMSWRARLHPLAALRCSPWQSPLCGRDCRVGVTMRGPLQGPGEKEDQEEGAAAASGRPAGGPGAKKGSDTDSDSDQETEGAYWQGVGGRLGPRRQGTPRLAGAHPSVELGAAPALCLPHHAPGGISSILRTGFQNEVKRQPPPPPPRTV